LRFKDKLKSNLSSAQIDHSDFEHIAIDRKAWRSACHRGIKQFSSTSINKLREARERMKVSANVSAAHSALIPTLAKNVDFFTSH
jgi:hypothetical protein